MRLTNTANLEYCDNCGEYVSATHFCARLGSDNASKGWNTAGWEDKRIADALERIADALEMIAKE